MLDTTVIPAVVRVRACRKGLFAGQAAFGRSVSKTEWVYADPTADKVMPAFQEPTRPLARAGAAS